MQSRIKKVIAASLGLVLLIIMLMPWGLYWLGLSNLPTLPSPPAQISLSASDKERLWQQFQGTKTVHIQKQSPYDYAFRLLTPDWEHPVSGDKVVFLVAGNISLAQLRDKRNLYAQLTIASLSIWLTRNWTTEQILQKASEFYLRESEAK